MMEKPRCEWCNQSNELYVKYHDDEWGVPTYDDQKLFELLVLEAFQAGLSWETILKKRENFRAAFDNFNTERIQNYGESKVQELLNDKSIIRNRRKIEATISNAKVFNKIQLECGTFTDYIWSFTSGKVVYEIGETRSKLSDKVTNDMKKRGMKFIGTTIIYAYLQAIGVIYSHDKKCFMYRES